jgi:hypothetical protein
LLNTILITCTDIIEDSKNYRSFKFRKQNVNDKRGKDKRDETMDLRSMINVVLIVSIDNREHRNRICNNISGICYGSGLK